MPTFSLCLFEVSRIKLYEKGRSFQSVYFHKVVDEEVIFNAVETETFASFGFLGAAEMTSSLFCCWVASFKHIHLDIDTSAATITTKTKTVSPHDYWIKSNNGQFSL